MRREFRHRGIVAVLALILIAVPFGAIAADLDEAKQAGSVGERFDGLLGLVQEDAGDDVKELVEEINGKRRQAYREIAEKNGTNVEAVAALAGAKLIEKAEPGQYVMPRPGEWVRKPARP